MAKLDRRSQEESYLWVPFQFLDQILKAIFKCLGLLHQDSPTTTKTASSPATLNKLEEEEEVEEEVAMEEDVVVMTRGSGVVVRSRGIKVKAKKKAHERVSSGRPGQHN